MKIIFLLYAYCFLILNDATGQSYRQNSSMPLFATYSYSNKQAGLFSVVSNQASLARAGGSGLAVFTERRFMLANNNSHLLLAVFGSKKMNMGIQMTYTGFRLYNESSFGFSAGKKLSDKIDLGVQLNYLREINALGNNINILNIEAGVIFHISPVLNIGIHMYDPYGIMKNNSKHESKNSVFKFGLGYDVSDEFHLATELSKEEGQSSVIQAGFRYQYNRQFFVAAGYLGNTQQMYFSAGLSFSRMTIGIHCGHHLRLGITPGISFSYAHRSVIK